MFYDNIQYKNSLAEHQGSLKPVINSEFSFGQSEEEGKVGIELLENLK